MHGRALAAEREAGADGENPAEELDRNHPKADRLNLAAQNGFDVRDTAAGRLRREPAHEPAGNRGRARAGGDDNEEAAGRLAVSPFDQEVAKPVRLFEPETEERSDNSRNRAGDQREHGEREQTSLVMTLAVRHWLAVSL